MIGLSPWKSWKRLVAISLSLQPTTIRQSLASITEDGVISKVIDFAVEEHEVWHRD